MDFGYTEEEEKFRERLNTLLDKELTEEIARQNWEDQGIRRTRPATYLRFHPP